MARRGKSENMTGAKENAVEMRQGDELNLGEPVKIPTSDFHFHMRALDKALEKQATATSLVRSCIKAAKQVSEHLPDAIKKMIKLRKRDEPARLKAELETLGIALMETNS